MLIALLQFLSDFSVYHPIWTSVFTVYITAQVCKWIKSGRIVSPPGPTGLPFVGYLPFLGKLEYLDLARLQQTYGRIFRLKLGMRNVIVLSDFKSIKEAFNKEEISDRPPEMFQLSRDTSHLGDMNLKEWKESRRFTLSTLRTLGMGKNKLEEAVTEQIAKVVDNLSYITGRTEINLHSILKPAINNIIISLICGKNLKDDPAFSEAVDVSSKSMMFFFRVTRLMYFIPYLQHILPVFFPGLEKATKNLDTLERLLWKEIYEHEKNFDSSSLHDYMDHFISEMKKEDPQKKTFIKHVLNGNSQLFLAAGNDTTLTTLEWTLLLLAKHQDVQERVYQEIIDIVGKERPPCWDDMEFLPYLDAVVAESYRYKTIVPLADPHWVSADTTVGRYDVPKGTVVVANIYSVHMDSDIWEKPEEFNPDRFMTPDGKRGKDPEYLIPFSIGKRLCPGEKLARVEVFLFLGAILQKYKILPPPTGLNMEEKYDLVVHPKFPFVKVQTRE